MERCGSDWTGRLASRVQRLAEGGIWDRFRRDPGEDSGSSKGPGRDLAGGESSRNDHLQSTAVGLDASRDHPLPRAGGSKRPRSVEGDRCGKAPGLSGHHGRVRGRLGQELRSPPRTRDQRGGKRDFESPGRSIRPRRRSSSRSSSSGRSSRSRIPNRGRSKEKTEQEAKSQRHGGKGQVELCLHPARSKVSQADQDRKSVV